MVKYRIGIDLGGTKTEVIILDEENEVVHRRRISTPGRDNYEKILESIHGLYNQTIQQIPKDSEFTIGIGIPGSINTETQRVQNANTTCLIGKPFQKDLRQLLNREIGIDNDANCFTLAENRMGSARGYHLVFGIIMGTGCGGGICIDGKIHQGRNGIGGEWGHFSIDPEGEICYCGNRGCVETKISGSGVEKALFSKFDIQLTMQDIVSRARLGDTQCREVFQTFLDDFGRCLGGLISTLDPDAIVLGGGLSNIDELYTAGVDHIKRYAFHNDIKTPILKHRLGDSAGVFGAAWIGV